MKKVKKPVSPAPDSRKSVRGFSLIELLVVVSIILIITAIAIPRLLSARKAGQASGAAATMHQILNAEETSQARWQNNFQDLTVLMGTAGTCDSQNILPAPAAGAADTWDQSGYTFTFVAGTAAPSARGGCAAAGVTSYTFVAVPDGDTTMPSYFLDESGTIRYKEGGTATVSDSPLGQ